MNTKVYQGRRRKQGAMSGTVVEGVVVGGGRARGRCCGALSRRFHHRGGVRALGDCGTASSLPLFPPLGGMVNCGGRGSGGR